MHHAWMAERCVAKQATCGRNILYLIGCGKAVDTSNMRAKTVTRQLSSFTASLNNTLYSIITLH